MAQFRLGAGMQFRADSIVTTGDNVNLATTGQLSVGDSSTLQGPVVMNSTLTVDENVAMNANLTVTEAIYVTDVHVSGTLYADVPVAGLPSTIPVDELTANNANESTIGSSDAPFGSVFTSSLEATGPINVYDSEQVLRGTITGDSVYGGITLDSADLHTTGSVYCSSLFAQQVVDVRSLISDEPVLVVGNGDTASPSDSRDGGIVIPYVDGDLYYTGLIRRSADAGGAFQLYRRLPIIPHITNNFQPSYADAVLGELDLDNLQSNTVGATSIETSTLTANTEDSSQVAVSIPTGKLQVGGIANMSNALCVDHDALFMVGGLNGLYPAETGYITMQNSTLASNALTVNSSSTNFTGSIAAPSATFTAADNTTNALSIPTGILNVGGPAEFAIGAAIAATSILLVGAVDGSDVPEDGYTMIQDGAISGVTLSVSATDLTLSATDTVDVQATNGVNVYTSTMTVVAQEGSAGNLEVGGTFTADSTSTFNDVLTAQSDVSVSGSLNSYGNAYVYGSRTLTFGIADGELPENGYLTVQQGTITGQDVNVTALGTLALSGATAVSLITPSLSTTGDVTVGSLSTTGTIHGDSLLVTHVATVGSLSTTGAVHGGSLSITEDATVGSIAAALATFTAADNSTTAVSIPTGILDVGGPARFANGAAVATTTTLLVGAVEGSSTPEDGYTSIQDGLISGVTLGVSATDLSLSGSNSVNVYTSTMTVVANEGSAGNLEVGGTFTADSTSTFNGIATAESDLRVNGALAAYNDVYVDGEHTVYVGTVDGEVPLNNYLTLQEGTITGKDVNVTAAGTLALSATTAASITTPSLNVTGDVTVGSLSTEGEVQGDSLSITTSAAVGSLGAASATLTADSSSDVALAVAVGKTSLLNTQLDTSATLLVGAVHGSQPTDDYLSLNQGTISGNTVAVEATLLSLSASGGISLANNSEVNGNLIVDDDLTVQGNFYIANEKITHINQTELDVQGQFIAANVNNPSQSLDGGFAVQYNAASTATFAGLTRRRAGGFLLYKGVTTDLASTSFLSSSSQYAYEGLDLQSVGLHQASDNVVAINVAAGKTNLHEVTASHPTDSVALLTVAANRSAGSVVSGGYIYMGVSASPDPSATDAVNLGASANPYANVYSTNAVFQTLEVQSADASPVAYMTVSHSACMIDVATTVQSSLTVTGSQLSVTDGGSNTYFSVDDTAITMGVAATAPSLTVVSDDPTMAVTLTPGQISGGTGGAALQLGTTLVPADITTDALGTGSLPFHAVYGVSVYGQSLSVRDLGVRVPVDFLHVDSSGSTLTVPMTITSESFEVTGCFVTNAELTTSAVPLAVDTIQTNSADNITLSSNLIGATDVTIGTGSSPFSAFYGATVNGQTLRVRDLGVRTPVDYLHVDSSGSTLRVPLTISSGNALEVTDSFVANSEVTTCKVPLAVDTIQTYTAEYISITDSIVGSSGTSLGVDGTPFDTTYTSTARVAELKVSTGAASANTTVFDITTTQVSSSIPIKLQGSGAVVSVGDTTSSTFSTLSSTGLATGTAGFSIGATGSQLTIAGPIIQTIDTTTLWSCDATSGFNFGADATFRGGAVFMGTATFSEDLTFDHGVTFASTATFQDTIIAGGYLTATTVTGAPGFDINVFDGADTNYTAISTSYHPTTYQKTTVQNSFYIKNNLGTELFGVDPIDGFAVSTIAQFSDDVYASNLIGTSGLTVQVLDGSLSAYTALSSAFVDGTGAETVVTNYFAVVDTDGDDMFVVNATGSGTANLYCALTSSDTITIGTTDYGAASLILPSTNFTIDGATHSATLTLTGAVQQKAGTSTLWSCEVTDGLTVGADATFNGAATFNGTTSFGAAMTFNQNVTFASTTTFQDVITAGANLTATKVTGVPGFDIDVFDGVETNYTAISTTYDSVTHQQTTVQNRFFVKNNSATELFSVDATDGFAVSTIAHFADDVYASTIIGTSGLTVDVLDGSLDAHTALSSSYVDGSGPQTTVANYFKVATEGGSSLFVVDAGTGSGTATATLNCALSTSDTITVGSTGYGAASLIVPSAGFLIDGATHSGTVTLSGNLVFDTNAITVGSTSAHTYCTVGNTSMTFGANGTTGYTMDATAGKLTVKGPFIHKFDGTATTFESGAAGIVLHAATAIPSAVFTVGDDTSSAYAAFAPLSVIFGSAGYTLDGVTNGGGVTLQGSLTNPTYGINLSGVIQNQIGEVVPFQTSSTTVTVAVDLAVTTGGKLSVGSIISADYLQYDPTTYTLSTGTDGLIFDNSAGGMAVHGTLMHYLDSTQTLQLGRNMTTEAYQADFLVPVTVNANLSVLGTNTLVVGDPLSTYLALTSNYMIAPYSCGMHLQVQDSHGTATDQVVLDYADGVKVSNKLTVQTSNYGLAVLDGSSSIALVGLDTNGLASSMCIGTQAANPNLTVYSGQFDVRYVTAGPSDNLLLRVEPGSMKVYGATTFYDNIAMDGTTEITGYKMTLTDGTTDYVKVDPTAISDKVKVSTLKCVGDLTVGGTGILSDGLTVTGELVGYGAAHNTGLAFVEDTTSHLMSLCGLDATSYHNASTLAIGMESAPAAILMHSSSTSLYVDGTNGIFDLRSGTHSSSTSMFSVDKGASTMSVGVDLTMAASTTLSADTATANDVQTKSLEVGTSVGPASGTVFSVATTGTTPIQATVAAKFDRHASTADVVPAVQALASQDTSGAVPVYGPGLLSTSSIQIARSVDLSGYADMTTAMLPLCGMVNVTALPGDATVLVNFPSIPIMTNAPLCMMYFCFTNTSGQSITMGDVRTVAGADILNGQRFMFVYMGTGGSSNTTDWHYVAVF